MLRSVQEDNTVLIDKVRTLNSKASLDITMNNPKLIRTAADSNFALDGELNLLRTEIKQLKEENKELRMTLLRECK